MSTVGEISVIAKIDTSGYTKGASDIEKYNSDIERSTEETSRKTASAWDNASRVATAAVVAAGGIILKTFVDSASEIQSLRASFESLTGDVSSTDKVMSTLYDLTKKTAFENKDIQAAGRNYLAAGVAVDELNGVLSNTADIAGATGADLAQLTLPLTQTIARGKLQTQDFYQILNAGAGALRKPLTDLAGSKGFGSLADALERGAITSDDLLSVMQNVTKEGGFAFQGALKQSQTFAGQMSNLQEAVTNFGLGLIGVDAITGRIKVGGVFDTMSKAIGAATDLLTNNQEAVKNVSLVIGIFLLPAIIRLGVEGLIAGGKLAAGILLALGPIGLIAAAIAALVTLIVLNWDFVVKITSDVVNAIKSFFGSLPAFFSNLWGGIVGLFTSVGVAIGNAIGNAFKGVINGVLRWVVGKINGFINGINSVIDIVNKLPGVDIGKLGNLPIPQLAAGGIVTSATLAMIGEGSEPEAVIPLSKLDKMLNGDSTGSRIENNIGTINIGSEVDGERWLRRLSGDQEIVSNGLVPAQSYM